MDEPLFARPNVCTSLSISFENNCNSSTDTGNEYVVRNVKIKGDYLREVDDTGTLGPAVTFYFQSHEDCRAECASRYGTCFLWIKVENL